MDHYSGQDKHGSYKLKYENSIVYSKVVGAIGKTLTEKFNEDICALFDSVDTKYFGYLGDLSQCQAYTDEAEKILYISHAAAIKSGCRVDAYCVGTALSIEQLKRVRKKAGIDTDLQSHIFPSIEVAETFIRAVLAKIEQTQIIE